MDLGLFFDSKLKLVTSPLFPPTILGTARLVFGIYAGVTASLIWIWSGVKDSEADGYLSYFTHLSYIGLCAYFWASGLQTLIYARNLDERRYPLQNWPKILQYLHLLLYSTIATFPILVTIAYWALLASPSSFGTPYISWSNISQHALNTVFSLFEIWATNVGPMSWVLLPITLVFLGCYLGVAYITHVTLGFYPYPFLDPKKQSALLAAYIVGIGVAQCVIFGAIRMVIVFRERLFQRRTQGARILDKI